MRHGEEVGGLPPPFDARRQVRNIARRRERERDADPPVFYFGQKTT